MHTGAGMPLMEMDAQTGCMCEHFENKEMVIAGILDHIHEGDCILIKASRAMALEKIVEHIVNNL
jgi:UDP-N-acetylmuramyl pentapeptide synthase